MGCICLVDECRVEWLWSSEKKVMLNFSLQSRYFASSLRTGSIFAALSAPTGLFGLVSRTTAGIKPSLPWGTIIWNLGPDSIQYRVNVCLQILMRFLSERTENKVIMRPSVTAQRRAGVFTFVITSTIQHFRVVFMKRPFRPLAVRPELSQFARSVFVFL